MKYVRKERWKLAAAGYFIGGAAVASVLQLLPRVLSPGAAMDWMPVVYFGGSLGVTLGMAFVMPHWKSVLLGSVLSVAGFGVVIAPAHIWRFWNWDRRDLESVCGSLLSGVPLVIVLAFVGLVAVKFFNLFRCVGVAPFDGRCARCSYSLAGITAAPGTAILRCPECGQERPVANTPAGEQAVSTGVG